MKHAATKPAVYHFRALRDCAGGLQPEQRFLHAVNTSAHGRLSESPPKAEDCIGHNIQHGYLRCTLFLNPLLPVYANRAQIIAAILTKVYNLSDVYDTAYMLWYTREASVAVYVANLPGIWPLLRELIPFLRSHNTYPQGSAGLPRYASQYGNMSKGNRSRIVSTQKENDDEIELSRRSFSKSTKSMHSSEKVITEEERVGHFGRKLGDLTHTRRGSPESDERVLNDASGWGKIGLAVHVDKTIEVHRASWDANQGVGMGVVGVQAPRVKIEGPEGEVVAK